MAIRISTRNGAWSDPTVWGAAPPGAGDRAIVAHDVIDFTGMVGTSPAVDQVGTGTVGSSGTTMTGSGTAFMTQLQVGDILRPTGTTEPVYVAAIASDTVLTLNREVALAAGQTFTYTRTAIYLTGVNARLTVGGACTVRGPIAVHYPSTTRADILTIAAGCGVEIDASLAADPANTHYDFLVVGDYFQHTRVVLNGVMGNRAYFRSNAAGGNGRWTKAGFYFGGGLYARYANFTRLGTATRTAMDVDGGQADSCFDIENCRFDGCGEVTQAGRVGGSPAGSVCRVVNCTWLNTVGPQAADLPPGAEVVDYVLKGCISDRNIRGRFSYWTVGGAGADDWCYASGNSGMASQGGLEYARSFSHVLKRNRTQENEFKCPGTTTDCYVLIDFDADIDVSLTNAHPWDMNGRAPHDVERCVFESVRPAPASDFIIVPGGSVTPGTWRTRFNIKLPDSEGRSSGSLTHFGGPGVTMIHEHNTFHLGSNTSADTSGGVVLGESANDLPGLIESLRANIFWDQADPPRDYAFGGGPSTYTHYEDDNLPPAGFGYSAIYGALTGTHNRIAGVSNQAIYGVDYMKWSTAPTAPIITSDPQFVWQVRGKAVTELGIAGWAASLGATGTLRQRLDHALAELAKKNDDTGYDPRYNLSALLAYVREMVRPTNPDYANATYPGDAATTDAAGNPLGGTIGAMAYLAALPELDISAWETLVTYPLTHYSGNPLNLDGWDHYDVIRELYQARDYVEAHGGATGPWDVLLAEAIPKNREGRLWAFGGETKGHFTWNRGMLYNWERTGNPVSQACALAIARYSVATRDFLYQDPNPFPIMWPGSREYAFALLARLGGIDAGYPLTAHLHEMAHRNLICIDQWTWGEASSSHPGPRPFYLFVQSFMVGLSLEALITYWDRYRDDPDCQPNIPAKIKAAIDWLWDNTWLPADGAWEYADIDGPTTYDEHFFGTTVSATSDGTYMSVVGDPGLTTVDNFYTYGLIHVTSGALAGALWWINGYDGATRTLRVWTLTGDTLAPGDTFTIRQYSPYGGTIFDGGPGPAGALNQLIAPAYIWYYLRSGDDTYRARYDTVFTSPASVPGWQKEWNELYRWSFQGLKWRRQAAAPWPAASALTFTALDTPTGRANDWSGRLRVALAGTEVSVAAPVHLTFSDGGAGGDFRGNPILTTDRPAGCFQYRPPAGSSGDTITLSVTSDAALSDPAPLTFSVSGETVPATGWAITGPDGGPVGAPSDPFTLSLIPAGSVPGPEFDARGGVASAYMIVDSGNESLKLTDCTVQYVGRITLTGAFPARQFTWTLGAPMTGQVRYAFYLPDPDGTPWAEPPAVSYTVPDPTPAPTGVRRLVISTALGQLVVREDTG